METFKKYFDFLMYTFDFKIKEVESYNYALYAKFLSNTVGIYFIYEFRDTIPQIQFSLTTDKLSRRPGFYTIKELYKEDNFKLKSFYLDEIILYKAEREYNDYFSDVKSIEEAIEISATLVVKYAKDFTIGDEESYMKIDSWYKTRVM